MLDEKEIVLRQDSTDGMATLESPFTRDIAGILPSIVGKRLINKKGFLRLEPFPANIALLKTKLPALTFISAKSIALSTLAPVIFPEALDPASTGYRSKTEPMSHQTHAILQALSKQHYAVFHEQGTGKTKTMIDIAGHRFHAKKITGVLIVAPKGVHRQTVESQFPTHCGVPFLAAYWPIKRYEGQRLPFGLEPDPDPSALKVLSLNIDAIKTKLGGTLCDQFIAAHQGRVMMVIDESHTIKNTSSGRWKAAKRLGDKCRYRLCLTGTPLGQNLVDVWSQFQWLDPRVLNLNSRTAFQSRYCVLGGYLGKEVVGTKNQEQFRGLIDSFMDRVTAETVGILPPRWDTWYFDLENKQVDMIKALKRGYKSKRDQFGADVPFEIRAEAMVTFTRIQQITNGFTVIPDKEEIFPLFDDPLENPRIKMLMEYLDSREGKVVIWTRFREDIRQISKAMKSLKKTHVTYQGGMNSSEETAAIAAFLDPKGAQYFISNAAKGGTGLNLQGVGRYAIYYSNGSSFIDRKQSEFRINRIGGMSGIVYTDLITKQGGVDTRIMELLANKQSLSFEILDKDPFWQEE